MKFIGSVICVLAACFLYNVEILREPQASALLPIALITVVYLRLGFTYAVSISFIAGLYSDMHHLSLGPDVLLYLVCAFFLPRLESLTRTLRKNTRLILICFGSAAFFLIVLTMFQGVLYGFQHYIQRSALIGSFYGIILTTVAALLMERLSRLLPMSRNA